MSSLFSCWNISSERNSVLNSYAATLGVTYILKFSIDRKRPNGAGLSFPSGHTSAAFVGAYYLHSKFGKKVGTYAYILAAGVGYSRMHSGKHYFTDVLAGAVLGVTVSWYLDNSRLKANPVIDPRGGKGIRISYSF